MSTANLTHPYYCKFYYPHTSTYATATAKVSIKAPERGDSRTKGRNQSFARTKNGQVVVYDMGNNLSDMLKISFDHMPQAEYAAMLVFFDYVTWGGNKIKYVDYKGDEYIVRVYRNNVTAVNKGELKFDSMTDTLYDFDLELVDLTNNPIDNGITAMPSQLAIHLADYNHPHNPKTVANVASTDGTKVIESVSVDDNKHVSWLIVLHSGTTYMRSMFVHCGHNGSSTTDATTITNTNTVLNDTGTVPGDITVTVDLNGANVAQVARLKIAKTAGNVDVIVRRIKV